MPVSSHDNKSHMIYTIVVLGIAVISITAGLLNSPANMPSAFAVQEQQQQKFTAKMTGSEEVPPKNTQATGTAEFTLSPDDKTLSYKVSVNNINSVTMAHIHSGKRGVNGPVVVTLFHAPTRTHTTIMGFLSQYIPFLRTPISGVLSQATITSANLEGPLKGKEISDLISLIKSGQAYANVHTKENPKGEIRGQIS